MQNARNLANAKCAQHAATSRRTVRTLDELRMALDDKARGVQIARLRKMKRLTQQAMAERLGVGYRTVQTWESGTMPEWRNLERMATLFGVRVEDIIGDDEAATPSQAERIEAKLDAILEHLGIDAEPATRFGDRVRAEAERTGERQPSEPAARAGAGAAGAAR